MTDAQHLLDLAVKQYNEVADSMEKHFETVADQLREWMPNVTLPIQRPPPPPPPPVRIIALSRIQTLQKWCGEHQALTAAAVAFFGTGAAYLWFQRTSERRRRRAKRTSMGGRTQIVVVTGGLSSPLTTDIVLGLERRGFIVYFVINDAAEERHVKSLSKVDIIPLLLDPTNTSTAQTQMQRLTATLSRENGPRLELAGVVMISDSQHDATPISDITPEDWAVTLNSQVVAPLATAHWLVPLVTKLGSRMIHLAPAIPTALQLPRHALVNTVAGALDAYSNTLAAELQSSGAGFAHFRLGNVYLPGPSGHGATAATKQSSQKGTLSRKLHDSLFDALETDRPNGTWYVGRGSRTYSLIGALVPRNLLGWILAQRQQTTHQTPSPRLKITDSEDESSDGSKEWERVQAEATSRADHR